MVVSRSRNKYRQHVVIAQAAKSAQSAREALCDPTTKFYNSVDKALSFELEYSLHRIPFLFAPTGLK